VAPPSPPDAALLADRSNPADSFSTFYRRHARGILAYCAQRGLSAHDAADATSDVFVAALTQRYRFDASRGESATPWLYAIATNTINGRHRKSAREQAAHDRLGPLEVTEADVADYAALRAEVDEALAAIGDLPEEQRSAVLARHLEDADYIELAQRQGVSEQVVRQRVSRALNSVRQRMGGRS